MLLPHFVRNVLPSPLAGLVFAGLFAATMSVFSSGLNSLATATSMDFVERLRRSPSGSGGLTIRDARWITLAWGAAVTLAAIGVHYAHMGSLLQAAAATIAFFSGPLLGMFLLGILTRRATSAGAIVGAIFGFAVSWCLANQVAFIWYAVTGCVPAVIVGYAISLLAPAPSSKDVLSMTLWGRSGPSETAVNADDHQGQT